MQTPASAMPKHEATSGIAIRRVRPSDSEDLSGFYAALSEADLRTRFLGHTRGLTGAAARSFCVLDHMHDEGFVALAIESGRNRIVGHVCLVHIGPGQVELGIAVATDCKGQGIGRRLFDAALAWSRDRRFMSIVATCYADNSRVLGLLASAPFGASVAWSDAGVVDVVIPLQPLSERSYSLPISRPELRRVAVPRRVHGMPISRCCRASWRRKRQPGHAVAGSASIGSS